MNQNTRVIQAFLCHSSNDKENVRIFYKQLLINDINAWLDEEKLIAGQEWEIEIPKALERSDVVIIFLSKSSITKEGYVQKEIKFALDIAERKPEGTIFIIPARLEICDIPSRLSKYQWVDLFADGGFQKLLFAIQTRANDIYQKNKLKETKNSATVENETPQNSLAISNAEISLLSELRNALSELREFDTNKSLINFISLTELSFYVNEIPLSEFGGKYERIESVLSFLAKKELANGKLAIEELINSLSRNYDTSDKRRQNLEKIMVKLKKRS